MEVLNIFKNKILWRYKNCCFLISLLLIIGYSLKMQKPGVIWDSGEEALDSASRDLEKPCGFTAD